MIVDVLNELESTGKLKALLNAGLISTKVIFYREAYLRVKAYTSVYSLTIGVAISEVAEELRVDERTVRRAVKAMQSSSIIEETED